MNHHDDTPDALALRRALRALADDMVPPAALWDRIAAQLPFASAVVLAPARSAWRTPWPALAAALLLGVGLGLLLPQALQARALAARDVAGQRALQTALLQLDQAQASLGAAARAATGQLHYRNARANRFAARGHRAAPARQLTPLFTPAPAGPIHPRSTPCPCTSRIMIAAWRAMF